MYKLDIIRESNNGPKAIIRRSDSLARVVGASLVLGCLLELNPVQLGRKGLLVQEEEGFSPGSIHSYIRPLTVPLVHVIVTEDKVYRHTEPGFENTGLGSRASPTNYELCGFTDPGRLKIKDGKEDM